MMAQARLPSPREAMLNCFLRRSPTLRTFNPLRNLSTDSCGLTPPSPFSAMLNPCAPRDDKQNTSPRSASTLHIGGRGKTRSVLKFRRGRYCKTVFGKMGARARSSGRNLPCCCLYIAVLSVCSSTRLAQRWSLVCFVQKRYKRRESAQEIASKDFKLDPEFV